MRTGSARKAEFEGKHRSVFSLSAALPVTSMNGERAAKQIIAACKRGQSEITLTTKPQIAATFHGLCPDRQQTCWTQ